MKINYMEGLTLGQALKMSGLVQTGGHAKMVIQSGEVQVNGKTETKRGAKMQKGFLIDYEGDTIEIV